MEFTKLFKAGLLASTSALALAGGIDGANAQGGPGQGLLGFYGGIGLGWESNSGRVKVDDTSSVYTWRNSLSSSGITGNIFGGYRMMVSGPWVIGGELKFTVGGAFGNVCGGSGDKYDTDCGGNTLAVRNKFGFNAALTAGYLMANGVLPYVKVGYAGKSNKITGSVYSISSSFNSSKWLNGIEFGAGVDIPMGIIGGAINMPAFIRLDASYTIFGRGSSCPTHGCDDGHVSYGPNTFQAGVALGVKF